MRLRFWAWFVAYAVLAFSDNPAVAAKMGHVELKQTEFGTGVKTGFGLVQYHDTCVTFQVFFISGNFFDGLRQYKTPTGTEFRKKNESATYRNFPAQLVVDVEALPYKCNTKATEIIPPDYAAGLMAGASFEVVWKRGDKTRPVVLLATQERHHSHSLGWSYFLTVPSNGVPLTDSLVIDVSLRHGISQTHLTADLKSRFD